MDDNSMIDPVKSTFDNLYEVSKALHRKKSFAPQASFVVIDKDEFTGKNRKKLQDRHGDSHTIDIDTAFEEPLPSRKWSIYRVTAIIQDADEREAFRPRMVSVGPFHYKRKYTETMEANKLRFLDRLLQSSSSPQDMLKNLEDAMRELEVRTRECYSEGFPEIGSDDFTRMMLVDGCFLIELFRLYRRRYQGQLADDPIFETRWLPLGLSCDILLFENQLPLFVLQKLYELTNPYYDDQVSLNELALQFFEPLRPGKDVMAFENVAKDEVKSHLLALFHSSFSTNSSQSPARIRRSNKYNTYSGKCWFYNAKLMDRVGVELKRKSGNILDIEFNKKMLKIPTLFIEESTKLVLKNIVAYEQSDRRVAPYFTSLVVFFSNLMHSPEDAELLMNKGIIRQPENRTNEVVQLFDTLAGNLAFDMDNCYLSKIVGDINMFTHTRSARFKGFLSKVSLRISILEFMFFIVSTSLSMVSLFISIRQANMNSNMNSNRVG